MAENYTFIKERVLYIADYKGVSKEKFLEGIGMTYGSFKGKAKEGSLNSSALEKIYTMHPDINIGWVLTGKGDMINESKPKAIAAEPAAVYHLRTDRKYAHQRIPLYHIEATAGIVPLFDNPNEYDTGEYLDIPNLPKCDGALFVTGDSMYPLLKSGDIIAYKAIEDTLNGIFWGEMYLVSILVDDEEYVTVKFVQKSPLGDEYIRLVSQNKHHQDKDVLISSIRKLAIIKASVRINSML